MKLLFPLSLCACALIFGGCNRQPNAQRVVLYCSVDDVYARPLIRDLEQQTGLQIEPLFDTEATKTAGLANRIRAERNRPRADVFWSSALLQTLLMSDEGLLQSYQPPSASDLPARFRGKDWTGVGVRARVLVTNARNVDPTTLAFRPLKQDGECALSNPQFGTASDWATAWGARWGSERALKWFQTLQTEEKPRVLPGNGDVARAVADGQLSFGWTDSDDFLAQKREKKPIYLRQTVKDNVLVPGAASLLKGAPNPENARKLLDAIVARRNEANLIGKMPGVFSLRRLDDPANFRAGGEDFSWLQGTPPDDYSKWPASWRAIRGSLATTFRPK